MNAETAFASIRHSFESKRPAQAYVLEGPVRGAAGELVDRLLQYLFCVEEDKPCGSCSGCTAAREHTYADLLWVEPQKKSRIISIEQIREEVQQRMLQTSFAGGWKACVLAGADRLRAEAANAFLKTLEEPPPLSVFFLLTDSPQFLLPTIVSRCQRVTVTGEEDALPDELQERLGDVLSDPICRGTVGSLARASALTGLLKELKEDAVKEMREISDAEALEEDAATVDARANARYLEVRSGIMRYILLWYRDLFLFASGAEPASISNAKHLDFIREKAKSVSYSQALRNLSVVETMHKQMEGNMPEAAVFHYGMGRLAGT